MLVGLKISFYWPIKAFAIPHFNEQHTFLRQLIEIQLSDV